MTRQWNTFDHDERVALIALADAKASTLNSLFRPAWRPEPQPCIPDEQMRRETYDRRNEL